MRASLRTLLPLLVVTALCQTAAADDDVPPETAADGSPLQTVVHGRRLTPGTLELDASRLEELSTLHLGEALVEIPGVAAVRRSASGTDPVIRGLGRERVRTQVGTVPVLGACPSGMDPPVTYFATNETERVLVVHSAPAVALGPGGLGGRILLDPSAGLDRQQPLFRGSAGAAFDSARRGVLVDGTAAVASHLATLRLAASGARFDDYEAPGGVRVPARQSHESFALGGEVRPGPEHHLWSFLSGVHEGEADYPALPMDLYRGDLWLYTGGYRVEIGRGLLDGIALQGGLSAIDHRMGNRDRPNRPTMEADTDSTTNAWAGRAQVDLRPGGAARLQTGIDVTTIRQDAIRTRRMVAAARTFTDSLWPRATQHDAGAFVQLTLPVHADIRARASLRGDLVWSRAATSSAPALGGGSVTDGWVRYYGQSATDADRSEVVGGADLLVDWAPQDLLSAYVTGSAVMRAAGLHERYFAFAAAPGGFLVGNPTLRPETKVAAELGVHVRTPWLDAKLGAFNYWIGDYVLLTALERRDVDGDGAEDLVRGFRNVDADLAGLELSAEASPHRLVFFPLSLSSVTGWNLSGDRPLPEIPPLSGSVGVGLRSQTPLQFWVATSAHFAAAQHRVDDELPENTSPAWITLGARAGLRFKWLRVEIEGRNLTNARYHEHLTREAIQPVGDLLPGDEIPAPGRSVLVSARIGS